MCGIAGAIDLTGQAEVDRSVMRRMAAAIEHRGPDEDGFLYASGIGLASRRLSIVGLADGQQPIYNEDRSVAVVYNGELFDFPEQRAHLESKGHQFCTSSDTEVLVHLWEEYGESMLDRLQGQFAFALYDANQRSLLLARDRVGICPLFWARRGDWLYFASEIKALLASGHVTAEVDHKGIDHVFLTFCMSTQRTAFKDISSLRPGSCMKILFRSNGCVANIQQRSYWDFDFPDCGEEYDPGNPRQLLDEFDSVFRRATEIRLRADVPVVCNLSGGIDSTAVLSKASQISGNPIPSFTIEIPTPGLNELDRAMLAANTVKSKVTVITCDHQAIANAYPSLIEAAESPVTDTSAAAMLCLFKKVQDAGFKVTLDGQGADEALAGYPWDKVNRVFRFFDRGSFQPSNLVRRLMVALRRNGKPWSHAKRYQDLIGGPHGLADLHGLLSSCRHFFYSPQMMEAVGDHIPQDDFVFNLDRMRKWHPLNRAIYYNYKTQLPGLLVSQKSDRPAMHNSVEGRFPFLDDDFIAFCAKLHPRWKLRRIFRDKVLLRDYASQFLPSVITSRPKQLFRAPFANTFFSNPPQYAQQLLSAESLNRTGYFDTAQVHQYRQRYMNLPAWNGKRLAAEMGLTAVMATQLWHHTYLGSGLCELPSWSPPTLAAIAL